jgi:hypothetical protein
MPAILNDILAAQAGKTSAINAAAKAVYDILKVYCADFKEGQLWQAILSRMRKANSLHFGELLRTLEGLELNSRYTLKRFGNVPVFTAENNKKTLQMAMMPGMPPHLNKNDNCYQYELIVLMFNTSGVCIQHEILRTKWFTKKEAIRKDVFSFQKPANAKYYLLSLHLRGGLNGVATDTFASRGMALVSVSKPGDLKMQ